MLQKDKSAFSPLSSSLLWPDIEDAIQYFTALYHRVDLILSRDEGLIKKAMLALPVLNPVDFVKTF